MRLAQRKVECYAPNGLGAFLYPVDQHMHASFAMIHQPTVRSYTMNSVPVRMPKGADLHGTWQGQTLILDDRACLCHDITTHTHQFHQILVKTVSSRDSRASDGRTEDWACRHRHQLELASNRASHFCLRVSCHRSSGVRGTSSRIRCEQFRAGINLISVSVVSAVFLILISSRMCRQQALDALQERLARQGVPRPHKVFDE